jgi:pimeloyl-ACP methyl ester carboxylesterase
VTVALGWRRFDNQGDDQDDLIRHRLADDESGPSRERVMPTMPLNGATIAYTDSGVPPGRPDAATIVFGHGLLFSGWMFDAQVSALRTQYRCVTVDWRGQGETPATPGGYDMDTLTDDAVALIGGLHLAPVHYVGLSMGGFVGQRIAARRGELLRSLILLDTSADPEEPAAARQDKMLALAYRLVGMKPLRSRVVPIMFGPTFRDDPAKKPVIDEFARRLELCDRAGLRKAVLAVADRNPVYAELPSIACPTLVIVGADDTPTPPDKARRIAERVPGARLEIVEHSGHSSTVEQPEAITRLIRDFLAEVG